VARLKAEVEAAKEEREQLKQRAMSALEEVRGSSAGKGQ